MLTTPLCTLLGVEFPILNASMSETANGRLAAAVSNAGGFGMIGGTSPGGATWLREQIAVARSLTDKPFGVGFISCFPEVEELVDVALQEGVSAINHSFADPAPFVPAAHEAGIKVLAMVQTVALAEQAVAAGVDIVIAQGGEAGGHGGHLGTFALLPSVVDAVGAQVPVIAAGGIGDGRGLAAALLLGAQGVWMGTRFVASEEWGGEPFKQQAVVDSTADDTTTTTVFDEIWGEHFPPEISHRVLKNDLVEALRGRESEIAERRDEMQAEQAKAAREENRRVAGISAGLASGLVKSTLPAGEIVRQIVSEAEQVLRERPAALLR